MLFLPLCSITDFNFPVISAIEHQRNVLKLTAHESHSTSADEGIHDAAVASSTPIINIPAEAQPQDVLPQFLQFPRPHSRHRTSA